MGRIVRRFARFFEMELRGNFEQGLPGARLEQYEAGQILHQIAINGTALGGNFGAASYNAYANVTATGNLRAHHVRAHVADAVVWTGDSYGIHVEQECVGTGEITGSWNGIRIEHYCPATVTIADASALRIVGFCQATPTNYFFQHMSEDGGATIRAAFYLAIGGISVITNLFELAGEEVAWSATTVTGGASVGRIAVLCGGLQRYIALWG